MSPSTTDGPGSPTSVGSSADGEPAGEQADDEEIETVEQARYLLARTSNDVEPRPVVAEPTDAGLRSVLDGSITGGWRPKWPV